MVNIGSYPLVHLVVPVENRDIDGDFLDGPNAAQRLLANGADHLVVGPTGLDALAADGVTFLRVPHWTMIRGKWGFWKKSPSQRKQTL